jgi:ribosomal-protein-alanine N-acetyltransferase
VFSLQRLRSDHEAAALAFERENRAYFAQSISDRGDMFFERFSEQHRELMAVQESGKGAFYVFVDEHEAVVGRFNLYDVQDETAVVGYRIAERVSGRGAATSGLRNLCRIAREDIGLRMLSAATGNENVASQRVLAKVGFVLIGPTEVGGRHGSEFKLDLMPDHGVAEQVAVFGSTSATDPGAAILVSGVSDGASAS